METVLITGANKGIGYEVARQLAERGMRVLMGARDRERGERAISGLREQGLGEVHFVHIDLTSEASIEQAAAEVKDRFRSIDVLINNAGVSGGFVAPSQTTLASLRETFETNFFGTFAVTQAFLPLLRPSMHPRIINVSSGLGSIALHQPGAIYAEYNALAYCASKTALNAFSVMLANELRESGIKVNSVDPGYTATDLNNNSGPQTIAEGSEAIVTLATAGPDGATGGYVDRHGTLPW